MKAKSSKLFKKSLKKTNFKKNKEKRMKKIITPLCFLGSLFISISCFGEETKRDISKECNHSNYKDYVFPEGKFYNSEMIYEKNKGCDFSDRMGTKYEVELPVVGQDTIRVCLAEVDLSGANLSGANFQHTILLKANFSQANLTNADLSASILDGADFSEANLTNTNFVFASLDNQTNFSNTDLSSAEFGFNQSDPNLLECNPNTEISLKAF